MRGEDEIQLVVFRIGGHQFAFGILEVERILRYESPVPLPKAPEFLEGVLTYGGRSVPVVDLRKRLDVEAENRDETRLMILEWEQGKIGVVVDAVVELLTVAAEEVTSPPPIVRGLAAKYISGIIAREDRTIVVLAVAKILTSKERMTLETLAVEPTHE
jgi:purine-binding chemotaxis protein CheW